MANQQQPQQSPDKERREATPGREREQQQRPDQNQDGQRREQRQ